MPAPSFAGRLVALLRRKTDATAYLPEVDGLRFVAIFMVFLQHALFVYEGSHHTTLALPGLVRNVAGAGVQGVLLFFTLSGFILALPFARHVLAGAPPVQLKRYFLRRLIRLEPPYLVALGLLYAYKTWSSHAAPAALLPNLAASSVYLHNWIYGRPSAVAVVAWSLEIEVQFYLLAPVLFGLFHQKPLHRRAAWVALGGAALLLRRGFPMLPLSLLDYLGFFLGGVLVADVWVSGWRLPEGFSRSWALPVFLLLGCGLALLPPPADRSLALRVLGAVLLPAATAAMVFLALTARQVRRLLSIPAIATIGGMCYSIYLLHFGVIGAMSDASVRWFRLASPGLDFAVQFAIYATATLLVCGAFYLLVERPFMGWKMGVVRRPTGTKTQGKNDFIS